MTKRILILRGSPRENGNSSALAERISDGAREAGSDVENVYLHPLDIRACDACDECMGTNGVCVIKDDMQSLYPKVAGADAIVFASPIYWFTISAQMKLFIDRLYAFQGSHWKELIGKKAAIVLTYGDTDLYTSGGINAIHTFESIFRFLKIEIIGMVYGTASDAGDVKNQPELMENAYKLGQKLVQ